VVGGENWEKPGKQPLNIKEEIRKTEIIEKEIGGWGRGGKRGGGEERWRVKKKKEGRKEREREELKRGNGKGREGRRKEKVAPWS
jgi:hypothetical protein